MTSKDRAYLRSLANSIEPVFQVGKSGITDNLIKQVNDALEARELIKLTVLETAPDFAKETGEKLAMHTNSVLVQAMGRKITLYRKRSKDSEININKDTITVSENNKKKNCYITHFEFKNHSFAICSIEEPPLEIEFNYL